ncbi:MAG: hypothetical protein ACFB00_12895 [Parvularculaceae bacterium]
MSGRAPTTSARIDRERVAVLDVGSNSVRLVIYDGPPRAPFPICNEKVLCGLGRDMQPDGRLNPDARAAATAALVRFRAILDCHSGPPTVAVATAAVREATDGADFAADARELGFEIDILTGEAEARAAALGVLSFEPRARGLVGDMGGGSLELIRVKKGGAGEAASLPIGPFSLMGRVGDDREAARREIAAALDEVSFLKQAAGETLYAVGGAWRAIARIEMGRVGDGRRPLHNFEMPARRAIDVCGFIAAQSRRSLEEIPDLPRKRLDALPYAALVMRATLKRSGAAAVRVSAAGLREGLLFDRLSADVRAQHPLIVGAAHIGALYAPAPALGPAAARTIAPLLGDPPAGRDNADDWACARDAAALMMDVASYAHPDSRGRAAYDIASRTPLYGVDNDCRIAIALALKIRHDGAGATVDDAAQTALGPEERIWAARVGLALRFVAAFAPKAPSALDGCALVRDGDAVRFCGTAAGRALWDDAPQRRLDALAAAFDAQAAATFDD